MSEPVHALLVDPAEVPVWGLTPGERLVRQLARAGVDRILRPGEEPPREGSVIVIRADHVYDDRILAALRERCGTVLQVGGMPLAVHVPAAAAGTGVRVLRGESAAGELGPVQTVDPGALCGGYTKKLRKLEPPLVLPVRPETRREIERRLFDGAYKGVTDAITRFVWPVPARWVTRLCVRARLRPNHVTAMSFLLVIVVTWLFSQRWYGTGLVLAWWMTFLDTVDGKLARVTVTYTPFGNVFDHAIDIIHPPFWYIAWGLGIGLDAAVPPGVGVRVALAAIVAAYVAGRLVEGVFDRLLGGFGLFCWRPVDSYFRLVMARRNPNLVLLTAGWAAGRPDWGLGAVLVWTVASSLFLLVRLAQATYCRIVGGPLRSWLDDPGLLAGEVPRFARPFVRPASPGPGGRA